MGGREARGPGGAKRVLLLIDRTNGKSILTVPYVDFMNWSLGVNAKGQPINNIRRRTPR